MRPSDGECHKMCTLGPPCDKLAQWMCSKGWASAKRWANFNTCCATSATTANNLHTCGTILATSTGKLQRHPTIAPRHARLVKMEMLGHLLLLLLLLLFFLRLLLLLFLLFSRAPPPPAHAPAAPPPPPAPNASPAPHLLKCHRAASGFFLAKRSLGFSESCKCTNGYKT